MAINRSLRAKNSNSTCVDKLRVTSKDGQKLKSKSSKHEWQRKQIQLNRCFSLWQWFPNWFLFPSRSGEQYKELWRGYQISFPLFHRNSLLPKTGWTAGSESSTSEKACPREMYPKYKKIPDTGGGGVIFQGHGMRADKRKSNLD